MLWFISYCILQKYFVEIRPPQVRTCPVCRRPVTVELVGIKENNFVASLWVKRPPAVAGDWIIEPSVAFKCGRAACKGSGYLLSPEDHVLLPCGLTICAPCAKACAEVISDFVREVYLF